MPELLQDKVALVTGASSGLGAETAQLLSRQGATVFGMGRDIERLADVFAGVERGAYASVDIASAQACRDGVEQCVGEFGGLDVLVNVAGRHQMRRTESMTDDDWGQDLAVNLNGPFYLCRAACRTFWNEAAISSTSPPSPGSRARLTRLVTALPRRADWVTRALAVEYTADRLRVNAICPGGMLTPQLEQFSAPDNPNYDLIIRTAAPRGMMQPSDVANVIAFLASDAAAAIHGAVYRVDNGKGAG